MFVSNIECEICNKRYTRMERLRKHLKECHNITLNSKQNTTKKVEKQKLAAVDTEELDKFYCNKCSKFFENEYKYKKHKCGETNDK